jgi:hypothetical protein
MKRSKHISFKRQAANATMFCSLLAKRTSRLGAKCGDVYFTAFWFLKAETSHAAAETWTPAARDTQQALQLPAAR